MSHLNINRNENLVLFEANFIFDFAIEIWLDATSKMILSWRVREFSRTKISKIIA